MIALQVVRETWSSVQVFWDCWLLNGKQFHYEITLVDETEIELVNTAVGCNDDGYFYTDLQAGHIYNVCVDITPEFNHHQRIFGSISFRAELTKNDLWQLMKQASVHVTGSYLPCNYFFRDKPHNYFTKARKFSGNIMEVYTKDDNGDPASPINGQLDGLFFGVNVNPDGSPHTPSVYGPKRLCIPVRYFLGSAFHPKLYFADFYCVTPGKSHFVTLVMAQPGTEADDFCQERLLELDWSNNAFLFVNLDIQEVMVSSDIWIEVLIAEDIDINDVLNSCGFLQDVPFKGTVRHGGKPKLPVCSICNV